MQVAVVQLDISWESKAANHARAMELLAASDIQPGSLIVLPEMFDTGFSMKLSITAQSQQRESEAALRDMAKSFQSTVLGGVVGPVVDGKASNQAVAFSPDGDELVRYQKQRPFSLVREGDHYRLAMVSSCSIGTESPSHPLFVTTCDFPSCSVPQPFAVPSFSPSSHVGPRYARSIGCGCYRLARLKIWPSPLDRIAAVKNLG